MRNAWGAGRRLSSICRRGGSEESGFTIVEVLVVAMTLSFILVALISLTSTAQKQAPKDQERAHVLREAQVGLHRMTREIREAYQTVSYDEYGMDIRVYVNGQDKRVVIRCDEPHPTDAANFYRCVRWTVASNGTAGPKEVLVDRVAKKTVFTYTFVSGDPRVAYIKLEVPSGGDLKNGFQYRDVLDDGVNLRNRSLD